MSSLGGLTRVSNCVTKQSPDIFGLRHTQVYTERHTETEIEGMEKGISILSVLNGNQTITKSWGSNPFLPN